VALSKSTNFQVREWYYRRYTAQLPVSGQFVLFSRSWNNPIGVEKVIGFCTSKQYKSFLNEVESFANGLIDRDFNIVKYYLDISKEDQQRGFYDRKKTL
jgi:polyphosphate kinase 2 (PPK2 family)